MRASRPGARDAHEQRAGGAWGQERCPAASAGGRRRLRGGPPKARARCSPHRRQRAGPDVLIPTYDRLRTRPRTLAPPGAGGRPDQGRPRPSRGAGPLPASPAAGWSPSSPRSRCSDGRRASCAAACPPSGRVVPARGDSHPAETLARQPGVADRGRRHALTEKVERSPADDLLRPSGGTSCYRQAGAPRMKKPASEPCATGS
jgi:hypothetical protein